MTLREHLLCLLSGIAILAGGALIGRHVVVVPRPSSPLAERSTDDHIWVAPRDPAYADLPRSAGDPADEATHTNRWGMSFYESGRLGGTTYQWQNRDRRTTRALFSTWMRYVRAVYRREVRACGTRLSLDELEDPRSHLADLGVTIHYEQTDRGRAIVATHPTEGTIAYREVPHLRRLHNRRDEGEEMSTIDE